MSQEPLKVDEIYLERRNICDAITSNQAGIAFLQLLVRLTGFNRPTMSLEDAARRDVWLTLRPYIDAQKLSEIEHADIFKVQEQERQLMERLSVEGEFDELFGGAENE